MTIEEIQPVDVLAVGAHPDDVELGVGGLIHKLTTHGFSVGILDLTRGEMSTRGTVEERACEAEMAARVLGVAQRANAGLPDGGIANTMAQQRAVIPFLRAFRPAVLLTTMDGDRHPDHRAAHHLLRDADYFAGLARIETGQEPCRAPHAYCFQPYFEDEIPPRFVIDTTGHFEAKMESIAAHRSQFFNPDYPGRETFISSEAFWESIRTRAAYWGRQIGAEYGEPLCATRPVAVRFPPGLEEMR